MSMKIFVVGLKGGHLATKIFVVGLKGGHLALQISHLATKIFVVAFQVGNSTGLFGFVGFQFGDSALESRHYSLKRSKRELKNEKFSFPFADSLFSKFILFEIYFYTFCQI